MIEKVFLRALLLFGAGVALLFGLIGGLGLMGVFDLPGVIARAQEYHGALMVFGFVGAAITLERAVALRSSWALIAPLLLILGTIASLIIDAHLFGAMLWVAGFSMLVVIYVLLYRRSVTLSVLVQTMGSVAAVLAALRWASTQDFAYALSLAVIFVIMTVIGERVELAQLNFRQSNAEQQITLLCLLLLCCGVVAMVESEIGTRLIGIVLLVLTFIMVCYDVARHLIYSHSLPRFSATSMCLGYLWLAVGAMAWLGFGFQTEGYHYDVLIHSIFLGFVMAMIFAHAPIIFTSVLRRGQVFSVFLYIPVVLMQIGLTMRVLVGDLLENAMIWQIGGAINAVSIAMFMLFMVVLLLRGVRKHVST